MGVYGVKPVHRHSFRAGLGLPFEERHREPWSIFFFFKLAEAGVCEECGQKAAGGLMWEGVGEGRWLPIPSSPSSEDSSQL